MSNHDNQNQTNERKIYLKDLHQWVPVSKTDYDNYYRDINAYRRRQQEHGRCVCPANKRYLCDMDCWLCRFHKAGDELSLDYTVADDDGNEKSWLDDLADDAPSAQAILEERELLANNVTFHFHDGHEVTKSFKKKRQGTKWTEERREKQTQAIRASWTDERRAAASERMREIRSEKKWPKP